MSKNITTAQELHEVIQQSILSGDQENTALSIIKGLDDPSILEIKSGYRGYNALHFASRYSSANVVAAIIGRNPDLIHSFTMNKSNVLQLTDKWEIADYLLKQDPALIEGANASGYRAIHNAVLSGGTELVAYYLNILDKYPVSIATIEGVLTVLHLAAQRGFNDIVKMILKVAPDLIKVPDAKGYIPLHYAASLDDSPEVVMTLLDVGTHAQEQIAMQADGYHGYTPLHLAARYNREMAIKIMMKINPDAAKILGTDDGRNPMHVAVHYGSDNVVEVLCNLMEPVDIKASDKNDKTPLLIAIETGKDYLVSVLSKNNNTHESVSDLQKSITFLTTTKSTNPEDNSSFKALTDTGLFDNPQTLLTALGNRLQHNKDFGKAYAFYKQANKILEKHNTINAQLSMAGIYDSYPYEPAVVKEILELQLDNTSVTLVEIFSRHSGFLSEARKALEETVQPLITSAMAQDTKAILLLHDGKKCVGTIKLVRFDEDTCNFIYINPFGTAYASDTTARAVADILLDLEIDIKITDMRKQQISPEDQDQCINAGVFIIENLKLFDKIDNSSSKSKLVGLLPDSSSGFNPEQMKNNHELIRDKKPDYSLIKMKTLVPLVFKDTDANLYPATMLAKSDLVEKVNKATQQVLEDGHPAVLFLYKIDDASWSGLALKKKDESSGGGVQLFYTDPQGGSFYSGHNHSGTILKTIGQYAQNLSVVTPVEKQIHNKYDSGAMVVENLHKIILNDFTILSVSGLEKMLSCNSDDIVNIRSNHIKMFHAEGITVPLTVEFDSNDIDPTLNNSSTLDDNKAISMVVSNNDDSISLAGNDGGSDLISQDLLQ